MSSKLLVLGSVAFDEIITPFASSGKIIGGAGFYISLAAKHFNKNIQLVSIVGNDFPHEELTYLKQNNINTDAITIDKNQKSFFWKGEYHLDMNTRDTLDTQVNVLADFMPTLPDTHTTPDFVMLGNCAPSLQLHVLNQFKTKPQLVALDTMNFWMDIAWDDLMKVLQKVDLLFLNDSEAKQLTKEYSLVKAAKKILTMGPKYLVIKKGEHGALFFYNNEVFCCPALPLEEVFDPTGAGDSFAGGFMGFLANISKHHKITFNNMKNAIIAGTAIASFCVEKFGTQRLKEITSKDLENRIIQLTDLSQIELELI